jgi:flagellar assembly protein FliH
MKNFKSINQLGSVLKSGQDEDLDVWPIPSVADNVAADEGHNKTNAFGRQSHCQNEPTPVETAEVMPLTADEIEAIRQAAHDEGFNQGKEEGFTAGFDQGKREGHQEGLAEGHQEGINTGLAEGKETIVQLSQQWQSLTEQLYHPLQVVEKNIEQQLLQLVVQLTEAVTLQEAKTNPDIVLAAIVEGIKALPSQNMQTQILVHPDDIKLIEKQFSVEHITEQGWKLLAAPHLKPGSCQIENSTSHIDLSIKTRLQEVLDSFLQDALHQ